MPDIVPVAPPGPFVQLPNLPSPFDIVPLYFVLKALSP